MDKKITYVDALNVVIEGREITPEVIEKLTALRDVTEKRNGGTKKPTKTQRENEVLKQAIYDFMEPTVPYTNPQLQGEVPELDGLSIQKITNLMTQLAKEGRVERTKDKRIIHYTKVVEE